ncbi:MAG: hypothetical protein JNL50_13760 [Phycisphaerae bacterium]|nr:hypothetical protein [Phycisphaerae bacterium]
MADLRDEFTWPTERRELLEWFRKDAISLADAYAGAVHLLQDQTFPGRVHAICHFVRDIFDRLPFALQPHLESQRVQYEGELDEIAKRWTPIEPIHRSEAGVEADHFIQVPLEVARRLDALVNDHRARRRRPKNVELLFQYLMQQEGADAESSRAIVDQCVKTHAWFVSRAHLPEKGAVTAPEPEFQKRFEQLEHTLHSFVGHFHTGVAQLDAILRATNARSS